MQRNVIEVEEHLAGVLVANVDVMSLPDSRSVWTSRIGDGRRTHSIVKR